MNGTVTISIEDFQALLDTKIKTVQGVGTALATALGAVAAWLGMTTK